MSTPSRSRSSTMGSKCYFGYHMMRSEEELSPTHEVQLDEISDSTRVSTKRRCDRRSCLSDAMQVGLGP
ncbi:hypothetical protein AAG906_005413 [Vitis piasezkii]